MVDLYAPSLAEHISTLFNLALEKQYAPLQEETLALLNNLAESLKDKFAIYYSTFIPGMKQMLQLPYETTAQQELRANCITTIGCIVESVKDKPELCKQDAHEIAAVLVTLLCSGKIDEADA